MDTKFCWKCKKKKPLVQFSNNRRRPDGVQSECKLCRTKHTLKYRKEYYKTHPWVKTYENIRSRIKRSPYYKGIKNFLSFNDLKFLWLRDNAYLMGRPSIDRKNPDGDYTLENCRYIEFLENCRNNRNNPYSKN